MEAVAAGRQDRRPADTIQSVDLNTGDGQQGGGMETKQGVASPISNQVQFHGTGGEYFGIWIVNLLLTVVTFGIYSAWAKVRRLKYFYGQTEVAGARFEYHGKPMAILLGRIVAVLLFAAYSVATNIISIWSLVLIIVIALVLPWLLRNSLRFRMRNSSYRGIRFGFSGGVGRAYETFLFYPIFTFITLYLAAPLFHQRLKRYQHGNAKFGTSPFSFQGTVGQFYKAYAAVFGLVILAFFAMGFGIAMIAPAAGGKPNPAMVATLMGFLILGTIAVSLLVTPLWLSRTQNLIWNNTALGEFQFHCSLKARRLVWIYLGNFVGILLTLGLFIPWAAVRVARYRAESLTLDGAGDVEAFVAEQAGAVAAIGEEVTEIFDFDIAF